MYELPLIGNAGRFGRLGRPRQAQPSGPQPGPGWGPGGAWVEDDPAGDGNAGRAKSWLPEAKQELACRYL